MYGKNMLDKLKISQNIVKKDAFCSNVWYSTRKVDEGKSSWIEMDDNQELSIKLKVVSLEIFMFHMN